MPSVVSERVARMCVREVANLTVFGDMFCVTVFGAFAKLRKAAVNLVRLSVRPLGTTRHPRIFMKFDMNLHNNPASTDFHEIRYLSICKSMSRIFSFY